MFLFAIKIRHAIKGLHSLNQGVSRLGIRTKALMPETLTRYIEVNRNCVYFQTPLSRTVASSAQGEILG
jgi:hypothetical protein